MLDLTVFCWKSLPHRMQLYKSALEMALNRVQLGTCKIHRRALSAKSAFLKDFSRERKNRRRSREEEKYIKPPDAFLYCVYWIMYANVNLKMEYGIIFKLALRKYLFSGISMIHELFSGNNIVVPWLCECQYTTILFSISEKIVKSNFEVWWWHTFDGERVSFISIVWEIKSKKCSCK